MKPRDLLKFQLESTFVPFMESEGFRYSRSQIKFSRKREAVVQGVAFSLSRHNAANECNFWTMWDVRSPAYSKWYQREWGEKLMSDALGGCADWNIPGWDRGGAHRFSLTNTPHDPAEIGRLTRNVGLAGLPYLDRISTLQGAAEDLLLLQLMHDKAADFLLMAGEKERARAALVAGLEQFEVKGRVDQRSELSEIRKRLQRYF